MDRLHTFGFDRNKIAAIMKAEAIPAMLLTSPENVYYTTGYTALPSAGNPILHMLRNRLPFFSYVNDGGKVTLLCWDFSTWNMEFGADEVIGFANFEQACNALVQVLSERWLPDQPLGIESVCPHYVIQLIESVRPRRTLKQVDRLMDEARLIKSAEEIVCLRRSLDIVEKTCVELFDVLRIGMGRNELTREAKYRLLRNGADGISHITFSFAQANPEFDIDEKLDRGRLVTLDLGAIYRGYCSDNRRYAYGGKVPEELNETYQQMVGLVDRVGAALVPGTSFHELMDLARGLFASAKLRPLGRFNHVGHNIGLETEERWLDEDRGSNVRSGMVINIELYTTAATGEQVGSEETYIVESSGPKRISTLPRRIHEVE